MSRIVCLTSFVYGSSHSLLNSTVNISQNEWLPWMWFAVNKLKLKVDNKHHVESLRWDKKNAHGVFLLCMLLVIYKRDRFTGTVSFPRAIKFSLKSWFFIRLLILICVWYHITICFYWTAPKHNPWDEIYRPIQFGRGKAAPTVLVTLESTLVFHQSWRQHCSSPALSSEPQATNAETVHHRERCALAHP